ncbi:hypothetical protein K523DRAFT_358886 [Schizophyllum commune Tattone D]|nr:hypothetical protein K523DRAFT_358886 [Schizophyllum commune Tattone D]
MHPVFAAATNFTALRGYWHRPLEWYLEAGDGDVDDSGEPENTKDFPDAF